jgi:hypothetical protein
MMHAACVLCGRVGRVERHHPTRRAGRGGEYLDGGFVVFVCAGCHAQIHQALRVVGLDWPGAGAEPLAYRLRVTAAHVELLGAQGSAFPIAPESAPAFAALLRAAASAIDVASSARARTA